MLNLKLKLLTIALALILATGVSTKVSAGVIAGPTLTSSGVELIYTGIQFHANQNSTLTAFTL